MSAVWMYFTVRKKKAKVAKCKICSTEISRGGSFQKTDCFNLI